MAIDLMMPALSPTMEKGTLAKWLVAVGDMVKPGDLLAEIETDKATMEFEAADEGRVSELLIPEGADDIPVGTVIARLVDDSAPAEISPPPSPTPAPAIEASHAPAVVAQDGNGAQAETEKPASPAPTSDATPTRPRAAIEVPGHATPLAARLALGGGIDLGTVRGSGDAGRVTLDDIAPRRATPPTDAAAPSHLLAPTGTAIPDIPHEAIKLSAMRKTIARRLTESKQQIPHIYLTVDVRIDALLKLRAELNAELDGRGVKLSVNDLIIKAQALALLATPACNVQYTPDTLIRFTRADIAVAVSIPDGLITPIIVDAGGRSLSSIATTMKQLVERARAGQLQPHEYQGGTASLSNLGMFGIRQFEAVINPPQAMILAVGAGERRALVVDDAVAIGTVLTATGSFDHRAIDGADAARFMDTFRELVESPLNLLS